MGHCTDVHDDEALQVDLPTVAPMSGHVCAAVMRAPERCLAIGVSSARVVHQLLSSVAASSGTMRGALSELPNPRDWSLFHVAALIRAVFSDDLTPMPPPPKGLNDVNGER